MASDRRPRTGGASRRRVLRLGAAGAACAALPLWSAAGCKARERAGEPWFRISLAQWSLHRALGSGELDPLDFPTRAGELGFAAVEYVNQFYRARARERRYLEDLRRRASDAGVASLLIMCDGEGALGDPEEVARLRAVENHRKWLDVARYLGCESVRVNAESGGGREEQARLVADGLRRLCELADPLELDVLVENHGGFSSDGAWLAGVMQAVDHPRCGTLPDFGNFRIAPGEDYDPYRGVAELMPWARAVSAKSYDFDAQGRETTIDYGRMLRIVRDAGYRGWIGVEYEGERLGEEAGIRATQRLLERTRAELAG